jgi:hypothetical protein
VIENHPHRSLADFRRKLVRCLARHDSTFSGVGASDKPGAVQGEVDLKSEKDEVESEFDIIMEGIEELIIDSGGVIDLNAACRLAVIRRLLRLALKLPAEQGLSELDASPSAGADGK